MAASTARTVIETLVSIHLCLIKTVGDLESGDDFDKTCVICGLKTMTYFDLRERSVLTNIETNKENIDGWTSKVMNKAVKAIKCQELQSKKLIDEIEKRLAELKLEEGLKQSKEVSIEQRLSNNSTKSSIIVTPIVSQNEIVVYKQVYAKSRYVRLPKGYRSRHSHISASVDRDKGKSTTLLKTQVRSHSTG